MTPTFDAVLFDLDGTLTDSEQGIFTAYRHALAHFGKEKSFLPENARRVVGPPLQETLPAYLAPEQIDEAVTVFRSYYVQHAAETSPPFPGVGEMLLSLRRAGFTLCLATAKPEAMARIILDYNGLTPLFDFLGGATYNKIRTTKTQVIEYVLAQPVLQGKTPVMVGDRDNDMQGAKACGLPAVGVAYGYAGEGELAAFSPLYIAKTPQDVGHWLCAHQKKKTEATEI